MNKHTADDFFNNIDYPSIIDNIKGIYTSDGSISTLLDFERVLDDSDLYAHKNWDIGELVSGPNISRYTVSCIFMYPKKLMPDPLGGKRLLRLDCTVKFKETTIEVPVKVDKPEDFKVGTHFPKLVKREVWLVYIEMPKALMNDIREGSIDLAGQTIDLEELDDAYEEDLDKESTSDNTDEEDNTAAQGQIPDLGAGGVPPGPGAPGPGGAM
jgi:hypothetical protein